MIFSALFAWVESWAWTQSGSPNHRNMATPATYGGAGRRLTLTAAALLGMGAVAQAQLLSLKIDPVAKTYSWTGSVSFQIETGTGVYSTLGLGYNFAGVEPFDGSLPTKHSPPGLNARGENTRSLAAEHKIYYGVAFLTMDYQSLVVGSQSAVQFLGKLHTNEGNDSRFPATYDVTVEGDGIDYSLPLNVAADLSQLDGKALRFFHHNQFDDQPATGFLDAGTISVTPVPEPASVALVSAVGLVGFAVWRRRNNAKSAEPQVALP